LKRSNKIRDIKLIFSDTIDDAIAQAHHPSWTVELSMSALFKNKEYILAEVIGHEICHLLTMILYNGRGWGHYPLWKRTMVEMGFEPIK
jgi:predicted SprT family Zn-dependent metalloprotease